MMDGPLDLMSVRHTGVLISVSALHTAAHGLRPSRTDGLQVTLINENLQITQASNLANVL